MTIRKAFTLIELLVVISIIILVLAVLVPSVKSLTGNHSLALAQNRLSAMLASAREAAIDNQQIYGLAIYPDLTTGDTMLGFVSGTPRTSVGNPVYVDLVSGTEQTTIQRGVTAQVIISTKPLIVPSPAPVDRYAAIGFVLFDAHGHLLITTPPTANATGGPTANSGSAVVAVNSQLWFRFQASGAAPLPVFAGTGFGLYDSDTFRSEVGNGNGGINPNWYEAGTTYYGRIGGLINVNGALMQGMHSGPIEVIAEDSPYDSPTPATPAKENWMDSNGTILMVNQFTGELVEGQI